VPTASEFQDIEDAITGISSTFVNEATNNTTNRSSASTTEVQCIAVTLTSTGTSQRFKVTWTFQLQGSVVADTVRLRLRYVSGTSGSTSGTQARVITARIETATASEPMSLVATITGLSAGSWTVNGTIARAAGTGTVQVNGNSTDEEYMLIERLTS
jgi:hypothetical protein